MLFQTRVVLHLYATIAFCRANLICITAKRDVSIHVPTVTRNHCT